MDEKKYNLEEEVMNDLTDAFEDDDESVELEEVEETSTDVETSDEEKELSWKDIEKLSQVVQIENMKHELNHQAVELHDKQNSLYATIKDYDSENNFIEEELKKYSVEELEKKLKDDSFVESFFVNPLTQEPMEMTVDFENKAKEMDFKRGLLVYFKSTQEAFSKIDEEYDKLDEATREMQANVKDALNTLSDNVLAYIELLSDKANDMEDGKNKKALLKTIKYIRSGYDMSIYSEAIDEHPSIADRCVKELGKESDIQSFGKRYMSKLKTAKVRVSLIEFASDIQSNKKSFEELVLIRDEQYIVPDLFVYSLIRFFAMADWNDVDVRKAHASICLVIRKLLTNDMVEDVKAQVVDAIAAYLKKFNI